MEVKMKRKILLILCLGLILVGCENLKLGQKEKTEETKQEEIKEEHMINYLHQL